MLKHQPLSGRQTGANSERARPERFQLAPEIADTLVPDGLLVQKFSAYNGEPGVLYTSGDGEPALVQCWEGFGFIIR
ncbi:hypothetical protein H4582DRAFT_272349 [Lactarius indigo]|nr:hypothetical protein H4582DRAFT_272349 [Lactarius indigo]